MTPASPKIPSSGRRFPSGGGETRRTSGAVSWKRLGLLIALVLAVSGGGYAYLMKREWERQRAVKFIPIRKPPTPPPRAWRWATEPEWVVHEVVRELASWSALGRGAHPTSTRIGVHRTDSRPETPGRFEVEVVADGEARKLVISPQAHVWDPAAYVEVARNLLSTTAGAPSGEPVARVDELLLAADSASLRRADEALFAELSRRPGDPRLHEQAALLWASHALAESSNELDDARPFLNGVAAHLALARALAASAPPSPDAEVAQVVIDALVYRQVEAMSALDALQARGGSPAWTTALRLRVTRDARLASSTSKPSRLEMVQRLRAVRHSQSCRAMTAIARSLHMPLAADWVRATLSRCYEPEMSALARGYLEMQAADAATLIDARPSELAALLPLLRALAAENTHQPTRPTSVVPRHLRADTAMRHILSALQIELQQLARQGAPQQARMFNLATEALREDLPQRPLFEMAIQSQESGDPSHFLPPPETCDRVARLVADRPDLVPETLWNRTGRCQSHSLLSMVKQNDWLESVITPGTGRYGTGPWSTGPPASGPVLEAACRRAPWAPWLASDLLLVNYSWDASPAAVKAAYEKLLDYDTEAMQGAVFHLHGDEDEVERLSLHICDIDAEQCATYAEYLVSLGRVDSAERMWKRALASARDWIGLSNNLLGYVDLLLDRGEEKQALRIARQAADVYSAEGLRTLGHAYERLSRFDEAARLFAAITARYADMSVENAFYIRYRQRHQGERFGEKGVRALAELFPRGLQRKTLADFQRDGHNGVVTLSGPSLTEDLRRMGIHLDDFLVGVDGFAVENKRQLDVVLTFTDDPNVTVIVMRQGTGFLQFNGPYFRTRYGPPKAAARASGAGS